MGMSSIGKITGYRIGKNRDGDKDRVILQVELIEGEDVRSIELIPGAGIDVNPASGCRVIISDVSDSYQTTGLITDDLIPETDPGEKEIYSTDNPVTQKLAKIKLNADSEIVMNDGTKFAARKDDPTIVDATTDNAFITWISNVSAFINGLSPGTIPVVPSTVTGKINDGTDEVLLP